MDRRALSGKGGRLLPYCSGCIFNSDWQNRGSLSFGLNDSTFFPASARLIFFFFFFTFAFHPPVHLISPYLERWTAVWVFHPPPQAHRNLAFRAADAVVADPPPDDLICCWWRCWSCWSFCFWRCCFCYYYRCFCWICFLFCGAFLWGDRGGQPLLFHSWPPASTCDGHSRACWSHLQPLILLTWFCVEPGSDRDTFLPSAQWISAN